MSVASLTVPPASIQTDELLDALRDVEDPEFGVSIVDMGLIVDVSAERGTADVDITFTAMGCPATEMIIDDTRDRLLRIPGIERVNVNVVWDPIWDVSRLSAEARLALQSLGVAV
jgi:metal-sulfur cluster biosynthetic enzyme